MAGIRGNTGFFIAAYFPQTIALAFMVPGNNGNSR